MEKAIENGGARSCTPTVMVALGFTSSFLFFSFLLMESVELMDYQGSIFIIEGGWWKESSAWHRERLLYHLMQYGSDTRCHSSICS